MAVASPQSAAAALYSELIRLPTDETATAGQIAWKLRNLVRLDRTDMVARVALVQALVQQGDARSALTEAGCAWDLRHLASFDVLGTLQAQLLGLGEYRRADELMRLLPGQTLRNDERVLRDVTLAWSLGDLGRLTHVAQQDPTLLQVVRHLTATGLAAQFAEHQSIIRGVAYGNQLSTAVVVLPSGNDADHTPEVAQMIFVALNYNERSAMEDRIYEALSGLYETAGLSACPFWELMTPMVLSAGSRPTYKRR